MPKKSNARERIIDSALSLFQIQGYNQTGLNQILEHAKAPKGSLYHYFPKGKEQLACEAVEQAANSVLLDLSATMSKARSGEEALTSLIEYFANELEQSSFTKGCPVATIALEQAAVSEAIGAACAGAYGGWESALAASLENYGLPASTATTLLASIEGALILCRARRSVAPLRAIQSDWLAHLSPA